MNHEIESHFVVNYKLEGRCVGTILFLDSLNFSVPCVGVSHVKSSDDEHPNAFILS